MMMEQLFIQGEIPLQIITKTLGKVQQEAHSGGIDAFFGQIRADNIQGKRVVAIDYSAYEPMALKEFEKIIHTVKKTHGLSALYIYHSLGKVEVGKYSLVVIAASAHRKAAFEGCREAVEKIKKEVPVFAKEILEDDTYTWKKNRFE